MSKVFGYIRVSTVRQGKGVSLVEQKDAIEIYALRNNLKIVQWFEELETAGKSGRPIFKKMMILVKRGKADGIVMHKIDRSARNMRDWADLTDLADRYYAQIHFVHESVNLTKDNDRLSADMQAVVASHYIRNLRQETIKGLYGRLKQGIYPFKAPIGYLNTGAGNPKNLDPQKAPLVRKLFKLYLTEQWGIIGLANHMSKNGLRNTNGGPISKTTISKILNNPFYAGIIKVKGQTFQGRHEALITVKEFEDVQSILKDKSSGKSIKHDFIYRRMFKCAFCNSSIIGELQKGKVYYRCHTNSCLMKCIREEKIENEILIKIRSISLNNRDVKYMRNYSSGLIYKDKQKYKERQQNIKLQIDKINLRLNELLDLLLEGTIAKDTYNLKRNCFVLQLQKLKEEKNETINYKQAVESRLNKILELANNAETTYKKAIKPKRREIIKTISSNRIISPYGIDIELLFPFDELAKKKNIDLCDPTRDEPRTQKTKSPQNGHTKKDKENKGSQKAEKIAYIEKLKKIVDDLFKI